MSDPSYDVYEPPARHVPEPREEHPTATRYDERAGGPVECPPRGPRIPAPLVPGAICVVIWAMSGGGYFWPMWVVLPVVVMYLTGGRRRC